MNNYYEAEEDTYLLYETLTKKLHSSNLQSPLSILEIGTGSGYIISNLQQNFSQHNFYGTDINNDAVEITKNLAPQADIKQGNLLEPFNKKTFDIIYFNTPYLPCESGEHFDDLSIKDKAIYGGKKGYETILEFLEQIRNHMNYNAIVFMLISSQSKPHVVEKFLRNNCFEFNIIATKKVFFEELLVYKIQNKKEIEQIEHYGVKNLQYLSKGKHSIVLQGIVNRNEEVVCKIQLNDFIDKEGIFLEKLQSYYFIPKLYYYTKNYIIMEKIKGVLLKDIYSSNYSNNELIKIFDSILQATQLLDSLKLQKFEMLNPYKHIFIQEDLSIKCIDFERMIYSKSPKNTTQFLEYLRRKQQKIQEIGLSINTLKIEEISKTIKTQDKIISIKDIIY